MLKYIIESQDKFNKQRKEYSLYNVPIKVIDELPDNIKINNIINNIKSKIDKDFLKNIRNIFIGDFDDLNKRNIQAMLKDNSIWVSSNNIKNFLTEKSITNSIMHEIAHSLEKSFEKSLYSDGKLKNEYNSKKKRLFDTLKHHDYDVFKDLFFKDNNISELDDFLYKRVGYDKLAIFVNGLFLTPYSVTTLREYFASGFQAFFSNDRDYLKDISPILYSKIYELVKEINNENRH